jgi:hypothetical protein
MPYTIRMKRTQLYLDEDMSRFLTAESRRRHTTLSALVREAVAVAYGRHEQPDRSAVIQRIAGVWADRDDLGETHALVRALRRSARPARWARSTRGEISARQRRHH